MKVQPSHRWWRQRMMPGVSYAVWNPQDTSLYALESTISGRLQAASTKNALDRLNVMIFTESLRALDEGHAETTGFKRSISPDMMGFKRSISPDMMFSDVPSEL